MHYSFMKWFRWHFCQDFLKHFEKTNLKLNWGKPQGEGIYISHTEAGFKCFILSVLSKAGRLPLMQSAQFSWQTNTSGRTYHDGPIKSRTEGLSQDFEGERGVIRDSCRFLFINIVGPTLSHLLVHVQYCICFCLVHINQPPEPHF